MLSVDFSANVLSGVALSATVLSSIDLVFATVLSSLRLSVFSGVAVLGSGLAWIDSSPLLSLAIASLVLCPEACENKLGLGIGISSLLVPLLALSGVVVWALLSPPVIPIASVPT